MPKLRTLVKYALACDSAEQLGQKLRRRYERQQRPGIPTAGTEAGIGCELDRLFDPVK